jgi:hypothetical protein
MGQRRRRRRWGSAALGAAVALVVLAGAGLLAAGLVQRIPRSALQLVV